MSHTFVLRYRTKLKQTTCICCFRNSCRKSVTCLQQSCWLCKTNDRWPASMCCHVANFSLQCFLLRCTFGSYFPNVNRKLKPKTHIFFLWHLWQKCHVFITISAHACWLCNTNDSWQKLHRSMNCHVEKYYFKFYNWFF